MIKKIFSGYHEVLSAIKESAVWVDESVILNMSFGRQRPLSPTTVMHDDPLGLSVEGNMSVSLLIFKYSNSVETVHKETILNSVFYIDIRC